LIIPRLFSEAPGPARGGLEVGSGGNRQMNPQKFPLSGRAESVPFRRERVRHVGSGCEVDGSTCAAQLTSASGQACWNDWRFPSRSWAERSEKETPSGDGPVGFVSSTEAEQTPLGVVGAGLLSTMPAPMPDHEGTVRAPIFCRSLGFRCVVWTKRVRVVNDLEVKCGRVIADDGTGCRDRSVSRGAGCRAPFRWPDDLFCQQHVRAWSNEMQSSGQATAPNSRCHVTPVQGCAAARADRRWCDGAVKSRPGMWPVIPAAAAIPASCTVGSWGVARVSGAFSGGPWVVRVH
jgi:hypothetical protein